MQGWQYIQVDRLGRDRPVVVVEGILRKEYVEIDYRWQLALPDGMRFPLKEPISTAWLFSYLGRFGWELTDVQNSFTSLRVNVEGSGSSKTRMQSVPINTTWTFKRPAGINKGTQARPDPDVIAELLPLLNA